jgi:hypothetical protein
MNLAIKLFLAILILTTTYGGTVNYLNKSFETLKKSQCYTIFFRQKNIFLDKIRLYKGFLVKTSKKIEIVYLTNPPFLIKFDGNYIILGYEGRKKQIYPAKKYKNPILSILINFDNLDNLFIQKDCKQNWCTLIPSKNLKKVIKSVKVSFKNGKPYKLEIYGDRRGRNKVLITIDRISFTCPKEKQ